MLINREEVIKALEVCSYMEDPGCTGCPEDGPGFGYACRHDLMKSALFILKKQEPVEPKQYRTSWFCGECGKKLVYTHNRKASYCWNCGKAVKWE